MHTSAIIFSEYRGVTEVGYMMELRPGSANHILAGEPRVTQGIIFFFCCGINHQRSAPPSPASMMKPAGYGPEFPCGIRKE
jgi:hypothetical protein